MSRFKIDINPLILKWAREEAGFDVHEIADKIKVPAEQYELWEDQGKDIPFGKLKMLSMQYKRQLAVFFLSDTPPRISKPRDFRNLIPARSRIDKKVLMAMRDVHYFIETAVELKGVEFWESRYEWLKETETLKSDNEKFSEWLREKLAVSIDDQMSWEYDSKAYKSWRQAVEDRLGILIFQFPMPSDQVQGFCFTNRFPHAIVVNSKYSYRSRIFTIFHELGHIVRRHSGICIIDYTNTQRNEEFECNSFAGNFLVPEKELIATENLSDLKTYSNKLRVSREVYLRQLSEKGKISKLQFFSLLDKVKSTYKQPKKKSVFVLPEVISRASRGATFFNLVLDSLNQNRLSYTQASSLLNLKINKILNEV